MEKHISTKAKKKTKNKNTCKQKFDGLILWFPLADKSQFKSLAQTGD